MLKRIFIPQKETSIELELLLRPSNTHITRQDLKQGSDLENPGHLQGFRVNPTPCVLADTVYATCSA